jgi:hypothetical protein
VDHDPCPRLSFTNIATTVEVKGVLSKRAHNLPTKLRQSHHSKEEAKFLKMMVTVVRKKAT